MYKETFLEYSVCKKYILSIPGYLLVQGGEDPEDAVSRGSLSTN